jgi:hypothetical protein
VLYFDIKTLIFFKIEAKLISGFMYTILVRWVQCCLWLDGCTRAFLCVCVCFFNEEFLVDRKVDVTCCWSVLWMAFYL